MSGEDDDYDHWESGYYEGEDWHEEPTHDPDEAYEFDEDAVYYGDEPWPDEDTSATSPHELAEEYDMAFASYTDARKEISGAQDVPRLLADCCPHRSTRRSLAPILDYLTIIMEGEGQRKGEFQIWQVQVKDQHPLLQHGQLGQLIPGQEQKLR